MRYCIIGASAAGLGCANQLARLAPQSSIVCISAEKELPYNKCFLVPFLSHKIKPEQVYLKKAEQVEIHHDTVVSINVAKKEVVCQSGNRYEYDKLLIATGSQSIHQQKHNTISGIFSFYNLHDAQNIYSFIAQNSVKKAVVVGGGLTGIEVADALHTRGIDVTIIEKKQSVLSMYSCEIQRDVKKLVQESNVQVVCDASIAHYVHEHTTLTGVQLTSGVILESQLVVLCTGWKPSLDVAQQAGAQIEQGVVMVDAYMRTTIEDIYAAGDIIGVTNQHTGTMQASTLWPDAMIQGIHAAYAMVGIDKPYHGLKGKTHSLVFGKRIEI